MNGGVPTVIRRGEPTGNSYEAANAASVDTLIRRATVPKGCVWGPNLSDALVVLLPYVETVTLPGDNSLEDMTYQVCRVPDMDDGAPTDGDYQKVALKADGTVRTISGITDHLEGATGQISCSDETNAAHQCAYIPYAAGVVTIYAKCPGSMGEYRKLLFRRDIDTLHASNQEKEGKLRLPCLLPEDFSIEVWLNAAWVWAAASLSTGSTSPLGCTSGDSTTHFGKIDLPVELFHLDSFATKGEARLGDALKLRARQIIAGF